MRIVVYTHDYPSHVHSINHFIEALTKKHEVYVFVSERHKKYLSHIKNINFVDYTDDLILRVRYLKKPTESEYYYKKRDRTLEEFVLESKELYEYVLNTNKYIASALLEITRAINPDLIIRDSCSVFGKMIALKLGVRVFGYNTATTLSYEYVKRFPRESLSYLNDWNLDRYSDIEVLSLLNHLESACNEIADQYNLCNMFRLNFLLDPNEELNICFSLPWIKYYNNNYINVRPLMFNESIEEEYIKEKRIYVSSGHKGLFLLNVYNCVVNSVKNTTYFATISMKLTDRDEYGITFKNMPSNVAFIRFVNQIDELKKSEIFISHGGFNSIIESVFYLTPMIILPLDADQYLNGLLVEKNRIGIQLNQRKISSNKLANAINTVIKSKSINKNLNKLRKRTFELIDSKAFIDLYFNEE